MQMLKCGVLPCVLIVGAISAEGPGVQQATGRLEQVRTFSSTFLLDYNPDKKEIDCFLHELAEMLNCKNKCSISIET